jgi:hypothetical protein
MNELDFHMCLTLYIKTKYDGGVDKLMILTWFHLHVVFQLNLFILNFWLW